MSHLAATAIRNTFYGKDAVQLRQKVVLDSATEMEESNVTADYAATHIALTTAATLQEWLETDDLDEDESMADRLLANMVGIADANKDGELTEDEADVLETALEFAWDYMEEKGVSDEDCSKLLNDWDDAAAERIRDLLAASLADGDDAAMADIDNFVFGDEASDAALDAVYKKRMVIRKGKKVRINKRVSGHVRLSAKQKVSIRKAQRKAHTAGATMRRMKSMRLNRKMGLSK
ncbi:hypothetical protein ACVBEF_05830 [Glaciimonas sp. GG7]